MEYNQEILDRLHGIELEILQDFIRVCEENRLTWWAFGGAGIGALRHGGFIPWDDDIDVCLMRGDYEKLAELFREQYPDKYLVVNLAEYATCPFSTTRIMLRDSRFLDIPYRKIRDCPFGIFLDVYAFDNVAPTDRQMKRQAWKSWFYDKLIILSAIPFPVLPFRGIKGKLIHCATATVWAVLKTFRVNRQKLYRKLVKASGKYSDGKPARAYGFFCDTNPFRNTYTHEELFPLRTLPFEGIEVKFPHELEKTLTDLYGDFMQLPPPEKRKNHFPAELRFPGEETLSGAE